MRTHRCTEKSQLGKEKGTRPNPKEGNAAGPGTPKCARVGPQLGARPAERLPRTQRSCPATPAWTGVRVLTLSTPDACPFAPVARPSPAGRTIPLREDARCSSSAQGAAWRVGLRVDRGGLTVPGSPLAPAAEPRAVPPEAAAPHLRQPAHLPCSFKLVMSCSCFSSSELFILAGGAGDKRQGGRGEGDTGEGEQKARCRWRGVRLHYPEVGITPAPPPPGAPHAVRSSHAPTRGPRLPHLRRAGLGARPGRGVGRWRRVKCCGLVAPAILQVVVCGPAKAAAAPRFPPRGAHQGDSPRVPRVHHPRRSCPNLTHCSLEPGLENPLCYTKHLPTKQVHVAGCLTN